MAFNSYGSYNHNKLVRDGLIDSGQEHNKYVDPNNPLRGQTGHFYDTKRTRRDKFIKAWNYYLGNHKRHLSVKEGEPDDNVTMNLVRMTLDRTVTFLYPEIPEITYLDDDAEIGDEERWIYEVIQANGGLSLFHKLTLLGTLSGHVHARIIPANPDKGFKYPRIVPLSPLNVYTYHRAGDTGDVLWHELQWSTGTREYLIDFVNRYTHWDIYQYERGGDSGVWQLNEKKSNKWDSPYAPIVHWQHLPNPMSLYGFSEVDDLTLQDSLNLILSEASRILRYHASPRTIVKGVEADDVLETGIENMWVIENPDASVQNLEMVSQLEASNKIASLFYDTYLSLQRVTLLRGEVKDFQRVTNTGVRTVFIDALSKRSLLMNQYAKGLAEVFQRVGLVAGYGDTFMTSVRHIDPLPMDELERARVDELKLKTGVLSRQAVVQREGRSWELLQNQLEEEYNNPIFHPLNLPEEQQYDVIPESSKLQVNEDETPTLDK